jgi:hypothetical protein
MRASFLDRIERAAYVLIAISVAVLLMVLALGCTPAPKPLSPDAQIAFHAERVVRVLDVVRDAAIAANEVTPPLLTTADTRAVVLWHKTAVQTIQVTPRGWRPTVKAGIYTLTCHPLAAPVPAAPCTAQLPPEAVQRLYPYVGLALVVIAEVQ